MLHIALANNYVVLDKILPRIIFGELVENVFCMHTYTYLCKNIIGGFPKIANHQNLLLANISSHTVTQIFLSFYLL